MTLYYVDTSAVIRAYLADEADHEPLHRLLFEGTEPVVTSELTRVEFASTIAAAHRANRVSDPGPLLDAFDADCDDVITMLVLDPDTVLPLARRLVTEHSLRTLDALHLAVASTAAAQLAAGEPVCMVTRDQRQGAAATALGLAVV